MDAWEKAHLGQYSFCAFRTNVRSRRLEDVGGEEDELILFGEESEAI